MSMPTGNARAPRSGDGDAAPEGSLARAAGVWLAAGALPLAASLAFHGAPSPVLAEQMQAIAASPLRWQTVHWVAAAALSFLAIAGFMMMASAARGAVAASAWMVLSLGALWILTTAVAEATAMTHLAVAGHQAAFDAWWAFAEGKGNGFALLALAVAVIAIREARGPDRSGPAWIAWAGAVAAVVALVGWVLGAWLGVAVGGAIWVVASLAMCLWLLWFGAMLARSKAA